jgi:hypothetical protein
MMSVVCAGLSLASLPSRASAQRDGSGRDLDDTYYFYAAKTYGDHAADHVHILRQFISTQGTLSTEWLDQHVAAVRDNALSSQTAYALLSTAVTENPESGDQLAEIQGQYAQVLEICRRLDIACDERQADLPALGHLLDELQSTLSGARAGHQELALRFSLER